MKAEKIDKALVKGVSRSFYLTLRLLPANLREMISLAYLFARASDTIADTASLPWQERQNCLALFREDFSKGAASTELLIQFKEQFSEQKHEGERLLMEEMEAVFLALDAFSDEERAMIKEVVYTIIEGQLWDLSYFQADDKLTQVAEADRLEQYTYQVAGCVGEFWTKALAHHGYISEADLAPMMKVGRSYGKGLQLTNIIRDIPEDYTNGRIYIPECGMEITEVVEASDQWLETAKSYLEEGLTYAKALRNGRLKVATILPAKLGLKTLALLQDSPMSERTSSKVKITRGEVFTELGKALLGI